MKKLLSVLLILALFVGVMAGCGGSSDDADTGNSTDDATTNDAANDGDDGDSDPAPATSGETLVIANLPKSVGGAWFNRMAEGIIRYGTDTGHDTFQTGADSGDAALQVKELEDLISQQVDVITVVPVSPEALEPTLQKARDAGIVVISHEAQGIQNVDWDVEAFDGAEYGAFLMQNMAAKMGEEGDYIIAVGSLTAASHMSWANGALAYQKENYPNMNCLNEDAFYETNYDQKASQEQCAEIMKTYPDLKGMFVTSATDLPGYALAVEEAQKQGEIILVGNGVPSANRDYIESNAIAFMGCWDPADAGYVMAVVGEIVKAGGEITDGMDLGVDGYNSVTVNGNTIIGAAWREITMDTIDQYYF